jgi:chromosome segregation ATPase
MYILELENKIVDLDSELEKAKLSEFESVESVMLINDSVNSVKNENIKLKEQLKQLDQENRKNATSLEDVSFEYESLKGRYAINEEKLVLAETELKKVMGKNVSWKKYRFVNIYFMLSDFE